MGGNKKEKIVPPASQELADIEQKNAMNHQVKIGNIARKIEIIFLDEDLTMADLTEVMDLFNARAQAVFSKTKLIDIKKKYEGHN